MLRIWDDVLQLGGKPRIRKGIFQLGRKSSSSSITSNSFRRGKRNGRTKEEEGE